ncbi:MAG: FAD-dependent oxidoreductase [Deltaproteobacteria bacterium]|nr:FAD-dependent oxidoreductase [Deltaproteobacteria bacterium]
MFDGLPDSARDRLPDSARDRLPDSVLDRLSDSARDRLPDSARDRLPDSARDRLPDSARDRLPDSAEVVVVGGGFAGAATLSALAEAGVRDCLLIEAEDQPGAHSSGLNAGLLRQVVPDPVTGAVLRASASRIPGAHRKPVGSLLLLADGEADRALAGAAAEAAAAGLDCRVVARAEAARAVPPLAGAAFDRAIATASDAVVDVHGLLWEYLRAARDGGARVATGCRLLGVETSGGAVVAAVTSLGRVATRVLVDAAGAWANGVAGLAGLDPLPMTPFRRHLAVTPPVPFVDPGWPFVWHASAGWYFRPEVGGLLLCACDEDAAAPGAAVRDPAILEVLATKLAAGAPALAGLAVKHWWAGLRTITADGRFAIGPDPRLSGFFWVAGLGGHGVTGSAAAGRLAAAAITGAGADPAWRTALAPGRFL